MNIKSKEENILIIGISESSDRYSNMAYKKLQHHGYKNLFGLTPKKLNIEGIEIVHNIDELIKSNIEIHTASMYIAPDKQTAIIENLIKLSPKRIIFNPGTENISFESKIKQTLSSIEIIHGCTLVMLSTNQF